MEVLDHLLLEPNLVAVEDSVFVTNLDFLDMAEQQENLSKIRKVCIYTQLIYLGMDSHNAQNVYVCVHSQCTSTAGHYMRMEDGFEFFASKSSSGATRRIVLLHISMLCLQQHHRLLRRSEWIVRPRVLLFLFALSLVWWKTLLKLEKRMNQHQPSQEEEVEDRNVVLLLDC